MNIVEVLTRKSNLAVAVKVSRFDRKEIGVEKVEAMMRKVLNDAAE